ncbi:MAG TPA: aminoglycoside phosphotransferase family protein [Cyclobacteriaceae bacterium]
MILPIILKAFGLDSEKYQCDRITSGHINFTYKLTGPNQFILQRINKNIFKQPEVVANNIRIAADHLTTNYPDYLFPSSILSASKEEMVYDADGYPWRLFPYISDTFTVDKVETVEEAFSAASGFGKLTANLWDIDATAFQEAIPRFHDLSLRFEQFQTALKNSTDERKINAKWAINQCLTQHPLVDKYDRLIDSKALTLRIMHNDTKINNILFNRSSRKAVCVIDLDTLMPGYFIYDLGDMIRTFVSPVSEEEKDFSKILFRREIYQSLIDGYFSAMNNCLTAEQKSLAPFAGYMMTYIMALRFLADYLNGDVYYQTHYPGQNLIRATNQLHLLITLQAALK